MHNKLINMCRPDVLELDMLLSELSMCSSRCELYFRFIRRKLSSVSPHPPLHSLTLSFELVVG